ncbi:MAG: hypothetical protein K6F94_09245 [Bacteroidaceae bacterium]|nr:hypothetical protein [Bacteroidaceae bacterium]
MNHYNFISAVERFEHTISEIRQNAHALHDSVNQKYDTIHPYGLHLDMVVSSLYKYGSEVCVSEEDVLPLFFGAYYHDSIEDARLTYNDVFHLAQNIMTSPQAFMATEIVYALTNDKGRTRDERAGERYYKGIRETPYAPFVKLADRLANITYSFTHDDDCNFRMREVYSKEQAHFLSSISSSSQDPRLSIPKSMILAIDSLIHND